MAPDSRRQPVGFELAGNHLVLPINAGRHGSSKVNIITLAKIFSHLLIAQKTSDDHQTCSGIDEAEEHLMVDGLSRADPSKGDSSRCRLMTLPLWSHSQRHSLLRSKEAAGQGI